MMQQQICQQEQMGHQQQQPQQVMLCPVRLVYETQILVQPGEQIQPNQTLFINPQNTPPWIQNRAQNQVIYMQQMPSNMMPSVPQHMDQNQMYLQNLQNYYPQQMIQMDQMRQMPNVVHMMPNINNINQITGQNVNNIGQNVTLNVGQNVSNIGQNVSNIGHNVSNIGQNVSNIGQNVSNIGQNVSNIGQNVSLNTGQNVMPIANVVQNVNQKPNVGVNTVNIAQNSNDRVYNSTNVMANIQMANHQNTISNVTQMQDRTTVNMNQNLVNMQKVAELQGMRPNVRQPQVTVSPMQSVKFAPNVGDIRPTTPNVGDIRPANSPRPMNVTNSSIPNNIVQANLLNKKVPLPNKPNSGVMPSPVRHYNQTYYRHIQPKPMSVVPLQNQYLPMGTQTLTAPNQIINDVNRKRKSESPDETRKKIPNMNQVTLPTVTNQTMTIVPNLNNKLVSSVQTDVGVNTSPIQRDIRKGSPVQQKLARPIQTASTGTQANIAKEKPQVVEMKVLPPLVKDIQIESDKLVRNTVFTQARGQLRTEPQIMQPDVISIEKIETVVNPTYEMSSEAQVKTEEAKIEASEPVKIEAPIATNSIKIETSKANEPMKLETYKANEAMKLETHKANESMKLETYKANESMKLETSKANEPMKLEKSKTEDCDISIYIKIGTGTKSKETVKLETSTNAEKPIEIVKQEEHLKKEEKPVKEIPDVKPEVKAEVPKSEVVEAKPVKKEVTEVKEVKEANKKFTVTAISDFKGNELQIADGSVRKEDTDSFILTHVLDGYVIQESNTAFPIRRPLKEKTIYQNTELSSDHKKEEMPYKHRTEDGKIIKDNSKILSISDLNLNEDDNMKSEEKTEEKIEEKYDEDQPFANLKPSAIKSWTVDQLAEHLSKYKWTETISVLSEHEIDGESLFLVSKQQLVQIGVSETHADVICEFVKKT